MAVCCRSISSMRVPMPGSVRRGSSTGPPALLHRRIRLTVPAHEARATLLEPQVDVGIEHFVLFGPARADLEHYDIPLGSILQLMAVGCAGLEPGAVARAQRLFARIGHQDDLTLNDVDELVLGGVPVPLARPASRGQGREIHPELRKAR